MNRFPRELPTHRDRTLSSQRFDQPNLMFPVKSDGRDYRRISKAIETIATPYVEPPKRDEVVEGDLTVDSGSMIRSLGDRG